MTCADALLLQIPDVAVTVRIVCDPAPALKVIDDVPWPPVIEPLVIDQL